MVMMIPAACAGRMPLETLGSTAPQKMLNKQAENDLSDRISWEVCPQLSSMEENCPKSSGTHSHVLAPGSPSRH